MMWMKLPFKVVESGVDESKFSKESPKELVAMLAAAKAVRVASDKKLVHETVTNNERCLVVGADTVIVVDGRIIGKPVDEKDAKKTITLLQGREHIVMSGLCVVDVESQDNRVEVEQTVVTIASMSEQEIDKFIKTGEWEGKAGSYQILGAITPHVAEVRDSVTNVVGLPLGLLKDMFNEFGLDVDIDVNQVVATETGLNEN